MVLRRILEIQGAWKQTLGEETIEKSPETLNGDQSVSKRSTNQGEIIQIHRK